MRPRKGYGRAMISAQVREAWAGVAPLTHAAFAGHSVTRALESGKTPVVHVQIRKQGVTACGVVADLGEYSESGDWFKVQTDLFGLVWVESRQVRLCSGDGRCVCEAAS